VDVDFDSSSSSENVEANNVEGGSSENLGNIVLKNEQVKE